MGTSQQIQDTDKKFYKSLEALGIKNIEDTQLDYLTPAQLYSIVKPVLEQLQPSLVSKNRWSLALKAFVKSLDQQTAIFGNVKEKHSAVESTITELKDEIVSVKAESFIKQSQIDALWKKADSVSAGLASLKTVTAK